MLEVIEHEQQVLAMQMRDDAINRRRARFLAQRKCLANRRGHVIDIANVGELDEANPVIERLANVVGHLQSQTRLADPAWSSERHKPYVAAQEESDNLIDFTITAQQWCRRRR